MKIARALLVIPLVAFSQQPPNVQKALDYLQANHEQHLAKQVQIAEVAAPTFHEGERAKLMAIEFKRVGLKDVEIDPQGNVLGWRPGAIPDALVIAAHLDIAFEPGISVKVRKEGPRWFGRGLADDSRGLAVLLALAEALNAGQIQTRRTLLFVANTGEEGNGDLNGVKYLFQQSRHKARLKAFISIDGTSLNRVTNGGIGVKRYKVTITGPGGHSYGNFGRPNAAHALGRIISGFTSLEVPTKPKTTYNIGRLGGGTSVNAIAEEAWMEVDLRSESPAELDKIELKLMETVRSGVAAENQLRAASKSEVKSDVKLIGNRPAGETRTSDPLVQAAVAASKTLGFNPEFSAASTDSNLPISLGIPAVTMGGGGASGNAHSLEEWFGPADAWKGPQVLLLTILNYDR